MVFKTHLFLRGQKLDKGEGEVSFLEENGSSILPVFENLA